MKTLLRLSCLLALVVCSSALRAAINPEAKWKLADDLRVAAMISGDKAKLDAAFSDELRYVHSSGKLDTKASFIEALASGKSKYNAMTYETRNFREVAPGLVLMDGRVRVKLGAKEPFTELYLGFLAVYRMEKGAWKFLAWQSCKLDDGAGKK
jgi:hypothetical protein